MNILKFHVGERGVVNLTRRVGTLFNRFGISSGKMQRALQTYLDVTNRHNCTPTFPVTTAALKRNPHVVQWLRDEGAELAIHGLVHTDYGQLGLAEQTTHMEKACEVFRGYEIPFAGFRCPYFRYNDATWTAAAGQGLQYTSNRVAHWECFGENDLTPTQQRIYQKAIELYSSVPASSMALVPYFVEGMVEIPISIPDDEAMIDRLGLTSNDDKAAIWCSILEETHARGEVFTISLHPERIYLCRDLLDALLSHARGKTPDVWIAPLNGVADWWRERAGFAIEGHQVGEGRYAIEARVSPKATLLARGVKVRDGVKEWYDGFSIVEATEFEVESPLRPFIGVPSDAPQSLVDLLLAEGHIVERSMNREAYGIYLESTDVSDEAGKKTVIDQIENSSAPLVRLWRWPNGARSCLVVSGDIDSITLVDFMMRPFEV